LLFDGNTRRPLAVTDGSGLAEKMLGLTGLVVLDVEDVPGEVVVRVESTCAKAVCPSCRRRAEAQDRVEVHLRDLHCFGRPCRLVINKRRWRCRTVGCVKKTWTEKIAGVASRQVLTIRAGAEVTRQVGQLCRSVASVADEYGVGWDTAWAAVELHGTPLVDDPRRVGRVRALGVDEHSYLSATPEHSTIYATSLVDLDRRIVIDLFEGKSAAKLRRWCAGRSARWLKGVRVVALDLTDSYRSGLHPHLSHARRVADPFHVTRVANRTLDQVRRRVQNEMLGHRGRKVDPLFRIRKLLLRGDERLDERGRDKMMAGLRFGDPHDEVLGAWLAKEAVRSVYLVEGPDEAAVLLDNAIAACRADEVAEIRTLGHTLSRWRGEILNHHRTGASNGPTEGLNFCAKQVKRAGRGFTNFDHYRLRVLLHAGGVTWPSPIKPPRITSSAPH
jgi:transposase